MNNSEIDLEAVRKTPEFRAISNKIKSVEKLEKSTFVKSPSPHILEIGRISRSGKKIFSNTNNTQNHVTPSNVASNSPIISPKHTSPELFDSTANYIDINTPNLSQIFDFKSSTPMVVLKNTPVIHPRRSRKSLYHSNNKNSEISKAKSKTEPRKRFKVKISFNSSNRKMDFDEECSPDETRVSNTNEMQLTPKSSLKPPPEVLKEKHSTAKKPVSKRSLIDHLIRSPEVAKELFKSPVKRILSQSMRHYDSILDGDNEDISIANSFNRDSSFELLTRSKRQSNNLNSETLKKNQKLKKSPRNNLSDFQGVRRLLRTPAKNKNDLTDVKGVKQLFKNNSPRNNLSNIGNIKKLFDKKHNSPKNNLMNITGVKNIFKETKPQNSPRNDLTNVVGVKELFKVTRAQKSPRNDLTNITGVKNIFKITKKQNSPRNDLTNIDGLKQLFRVTRNHKSPVNDLTNISGVKDIFEQNQIQNLFDVSETQKLSRIPKNQKSPRNDLTNITGVKNFFKTRNSPKNNLTNISNVGEIFEEIKTRNSFEKNSTNACGMKKSLNPSLKKSPSNSLLNVSGLENSFKSPLRSKRGSVDNLVGYVSPVVANQQSDLIRKKIALEKENSKLNRSSVNLYDPRDSICPSSSVLENVGLVPSSLFKLKSENNNSTNRSRRQATIDKTSFSLELSKVNMSAKKDSKPAKTDTGVISCHSTPFVKTKMDISDLRQVSPILPDIQNCEKSPVSRTTRYRFYLLSLIIHMSIPCIIFRHLKNF